ncbi:hypothetical protein [Deinococcus sp. PEB2-63]
MSETPLWFTTFDPQTEAPLLPVLDRSAVTPDPAWVQAQVGRVPFALVAAGQAVDQVPLCWEDRGYLGRALQVHGQAVAHIGWGSDTLPALVQALPPTQRPPLVAVAETQEALAGGLHSLDWVTATRLGSLLPPGWYLANLVTIRPAPVVPGDPLDYLPNELERYWPGQGVSSRAEAVSYRAPGWREPGMITFLDGRQVPGEAAGVSVLLPTQPAETLNADRVAFYREVFRLGRQPTAVSLQVVEERDSNSQTDGQPLERLTLSVHLLVDGHHKVQAAALEGTALTMLAFTALPVTAAHQYLKAWIERTQLKTARFDALSRSPE